MSSAPDPFTIEFLHCGNVISDDDMDTAVVHYSINGYADVPFNNLWRIARQWPNIAAAKAPSVTTEKMIDEIKSKGYDWRHVAKPVKPAAPAATE